jgi:hypothetical protein
MFHQWFLKQQGTNPNFSAYVILIHEAQFTISIFGQMKIHMQFFHQITNSSSPSTSVVCVVIIYLDLTYLQTGLEGGILKNF